jgi:UDP-glucose 4-epimerase
MTSLGRAARGAAGSMTSYLITGGAGFIGSHLADRLIEHGNSVVAIDDLSTGRHVNIAQLAGVLRFRFVAGSAADATAIDPLVQSCDVVIHLAAAVGSELVRSQPLRSALTNVTATSTVLETAARHGRPVLIASSSNVYGYDAAVPVREDAVRVTGTAADIRATHAAAKAFEESLAFAWTHETGLPIVVARLFNTAGARQRADYGMVVPRFVEQARLGRRLQVVGDGLQTRCFAHVLDVVAALHALADNPAAAGEVFNVGSQDEVSVLELAERVMEALGVDRPIEFAPMPDGGGEPRRSVPDIAKIADCVGWAPALTLDDIVRDAAGAQAG